MHTFYTEGGFLSPEDARHAYKVLRLRAGDEITAIEANERYSAVLAEIGEKEARAELGPKLPSNESEVKVTLYQGLPKAEKLELLAQKLTELGVSRLVPVEMERSVARFDGQKRIERLERISREAVKQCRRSRPVQIDPVIKWQDAVKRMSEHELMLVPWENEQSRRMIDIYHERPHVKDIGILIGCEGGISENEISAAPALPVTLGPRILRCETAAIAATTIVMSLFGDI